MEWNEKNTVQFIEIYERKPILGTIKLEEMMLGKKFQKKLGFQLTNVGKK